MGRDPIEEKGGLHLYAFVGNNSINLWDLLGRSGSGAGQSTINAECLTINAGYALIWVGGVAVKGSGRVSGDDVSGRGNADATAGGAMDASGLASQGVVVDSDLSRQTAAVNAAANSSSNASLSIYGLNLGQFGGATSNTAPNSAGFNGQLGPLPTGYLSPGIITPSPVTNPGAGATINVNGYGVLTIIAAASQGGQQAMIFTPNNGQDASNFAYIQYITNDPQNNQQSPYNGGGSVPYLDASVQYAKDPIFPTLPINSTGYYNDNPFSTSGGYNNGTPVYSNGGINYYDNPGAPIGAATFLIDKNTGTSLQQINWGNGPG